VSHVAGENHKTVKPLTAKKQQTGVDNVDPTGKAKSHVNKKPKSSINGRKEKTKKDKPGEDPRLQSEDTQPVATQDIDADIRVGVYHKSTFESAEDFLVGRLLAITHATSK
jgi:flagellar hook assembly protein FlgD